MNRRLFFEHRVARCWSALMTRKICGWMWCKPSGAPLAGSGLLPIGSRKPAWTLLRIFVLVLVTVITFRFV